jgi:hypothetical protein
MLQRLSEQRLALDRFAFQERDYDRTLTPAEWNIVNSIISLLAPIEEVSLLFCKGRLGTPGK